MKFNNPILYGDYSDPDVIRVGEDFYLISSSFTYLPGIPVLRSRDLVHWELIGYVADRLPFPRYNTPQHKCGTWAPSIRWHNGRFYVYVCLPDEGLMVYTAENPAGPWTSHWVMDVVGWIDPCPLFAADGSVWLVHALAASRVGINNQLYVHRLREDGLQVLDKGRLVYDGADHGDITVEGPKFYEKDGKTWIFCPAGGVPEGYQLALRAGSPLGPYERKVVLSQGNSPVNGPHQGGWVEDSRGNGWFIHFQDQGVYGRVTHLQPLRWEQGWPVIGQNGTPVLTGDTGLSEFPAGLNMSDHFEKGPGPQWQWQSNPQTAWLSVLHPGIRLHAAPAETYFSAGQFLSQLMQYRNFEMTVALYPHLQEMDAVGLVMMGYQYSGIEFSGGKLKILHGETWEGSFRETPRAEEEEEVSIPWEMSELVLRMTVLEGSVSYAYGSKKEDLKSLGGVCPLSSGGWVSARPGLCCLSRNGQAGGWADITEVKVTPI